MSNLQKGRVLIFRTGTPRYSSSVSSASMRIRRLDRPELRRLVHYYVVVVVCGMFYLDRWQMSCSGNGMDPVL